MCIVAFVALSACATNERPPRSRPAASPAPASSARAGATPAEVETGKEPFKRAGAGAFNQYKFSYERAGDEAEAKFAPVMLPWDDALVVAAAREVLVAAYDDRSENFPRSVRWQYRGAEVNAIKLEGEKFEYVFVPLREEGTGGAVREVRALVFWQLPKGTVR